MITVHHPVLSLPWEWLGISKHYLEGYSSTVAQLGWDASGVLILYIQGTVGARRYCKYVYAGGMTHSVQIRQLCSNLCNLLPSGVQMTSMVRSLRLCVWRQA